MDNLQLLKAWCIGVGIDPVVMDHDDMKAALDRKDGLAAFNVLRRTQTRLVADVPAETLDEGYQLEFMAAVQGNWESAAAIGMMRPA